MAFLLGTAGHVDHGKTTLIQALTGINTDRLPEEKLRGMTIELGFAHIELPQAGHVSIVDVPGHERFLTNMLAGATSVDVILLCIAADRGIMAQTREHVQILELLPAQRLVVALTRSDLVDEVVLSGVAEDVRQFLSTTRFKDVAIVPVSVKTSTGIELLKGILDETIIECKRPDNTSHGWLMPIDRVFSIKGFGPVVTGTLANGTVRVGEEAELAPEGKKVRIRMIHSHDAAVEQATPGMRVALNLVGVENHQIERGMIVAKPGEVSASRTIDVSVNWVTDPRHAEQVRVAIGADEPVGRLFLSDSDENIAQLRFDFDVSVAKDLPIIIRRHSPAILLGGGKVIIPNAERRKKSEEAPEVRTGSNLELILEIIAEHQNGVMNNEVCRLMGTSPQLLGDCFETLSADGKILGFAGLWFTPPHFVELANQFLAALNKLHIENPRAPWIAREEVLKIAKLSWSGKPLDRMITRLGRAEKLEVNGTAVRKSGFVIELSPKQQELLARVEVELNLTNVNVPFVSDLASSLKMPTQAVHEILELGVLAERIIKPEDGMYYTKEQLANIEAQLLAWAGVRPFSASEARDHLQTSRKFIIPLLEQMDKTGFTVRRGDVRVIAKADSPEPAA